MAQPGLARLLDGPGRPQRTGPDHTGILVPMRSGTGVISRIGVTIRGILCGYLPAGETPRFWEVVEQAEAADLKLAVNVLLERSGEDIHVILALGTPAECLAAMLLARGVPHTGHGWANALVAFIGEPTLTVSSVRLDRAAAALLASAVGLRVHSRITRGVQLLVDCDRPLRAAGSGREQAYGIPIVPERDFWVALGYEVTTADPVSALATE